MLAARDEITNLVVLVVTAKPAWEKRIREILDSLPDTSCEITVCTNIAHTRETLFSLSIDLAFFDLDVSGAREFFSSEEGRDFLGHVAVVTLVTQENEAYARQLVQFGAQDYIVKNEMDARLLHHIVYNAIERHRMLLELRTARHRERYLTMHDALTGLPNRETFSERLKESLELANRYWRRIAVLVVGIHRFRKINDSFGPGFGDRVLQMVAMRLIPTVSSRDTVARLGGDEFGCILTDIQHPQAAARAAQKIIHELSKPIHIDGREVFLSPKIGIAFAPSDGREAEVLLRNSLAAMHSARTAGRSHYQFYMGSMNESAMALLDLEISLAGALERGNEFLLHYQPMVDAKTGRVRGVEALLRWNHPSLGLVGPGNFISIAEDNGLIVPIGEWVLRTACIQRKQWEADGYTNFRISVNVSPRQFRASRFAQRVKEILEETDMPGEYLELEITESSIVEDVEGVFSTLRLLRSMGIHVAVDDFGTGYSAMSLLKHFPVDVLKIDQTFVRDMTTDASDASIIRAIVAMAEGLQLTVIAEGVETSAQRDALLDLQCPTMQGYFFARPVPAVEIKF